MVCSSFPDLYRLVTVFPEGRDLARHFGCKFIETSAKVRHNVDESFSGLVREIRRYNKVRFIRCSMEIVSPF